MTHAFSELYIENAQRVFAQMTHYVIHDLKMEYDPFFRLFVQSGVAAQFEKGNPRYVAGMSGTELADEVMRRVTGYGCAIESEPYYDRTEAYWTGFTIAWYQWYDNCSFRELFAEVPCSSIAGMYPKYHEMDLMHSADEIRRLRRLSAYRNRIGLKYKREQAGLSQRDLAEISGVPVRTIQQYEQQQKDIRKAAYETVCRLADVLGIRRSAEGLHSTARSALSLYEIKSEKSAHQSDFHSLFRMAQSLFPLYYSRRLPISGGIPMNGLWICTTE